MPYGVPKEKGGDSLKNTARMEECVHSVMRDNPSYDKSRAIAICKASLGFTKGGRKKKGGKRG